MYMHTCVPWFQFFFFRVCDVLQLVVVICTASSSMVTAVYTAPWSHSHPAIRLHHPTSRWFPLWYT